MGMLFPILLMGVYLAIPAVLLYLAWRFVRSHERRSGRRDCGFVVCTSQHRTVM
jgi:hypothetical protein